MEESFRNRIILILSMLTVIFFIGILNSCNNMRRSRVARDREMAARLDLEEKMSKSMQEKAAIEGKLNNLTQGIEEEKAGHQATKKALVQEQLVNQSLKEELEKVTRLKETLEEDLKEALVAGKSGRTAE